jgi:hypothetical protein
VGSWGKMGAWGASRGEGSGVGQSTRWGGGSSEQVCASLCISVCWATDHHSTSITASLAISEVVAAVWVVAGALDTIFGVVVAGGIGIGSCDVAMSMGGSLCVSGVRGMSWGELGAIGGLLAVRS